MLTQAPRGTKDLFGNEIIKWQYVENVIREICKNFGIKEIRTPIFEHTELFLRGVGETTDIVNKEMYTFIDKGDRSVTLRPESTAGIARSYIEHGMHNFQKPNKLYYLAQTFRYEKAEKGRQRQFNQFGIEALGSYSSAQDAEVIAVAHLLFKTLGIEGVELKINSLGCNDCKKKYNEILKSYLSENVDSLCPLCCDRLMKNPLRVLDCKEDNCKKTIELAPKTIDCLDEECTEHFETLKSILNEMEIPFTVDPKIVRGLDYYTKTVFEFITDQIGSQGTICGGGRYDNLVSECGGNETGAVGFGLGIERLILTLDSQNILPEDLNCCSLYIGSIGKEAFIKSQKIAYKLRTMGVYVECDTVERSVKAQMKYADKLNATYSMILGDDELKNDVASLKNMESGENEEISLSKLFDGEYNKKITEAVK